MSSVNLPPQQRPDPPSHPPSKPSIINVTNNAVEGLLFRAGEINRSITTIRDFIGSRSTISKILNIIGIGAESRILKELTKEKTHINQMLVALGEKEPNESTNYKYLPDDIDQLDILLKEKEELKSTVTSTIDNVHKEISSLEKEYKDAIVAHAVSVAGLGEIGYSDTESIITKMDKLKAQLKGLQHNIRKIDAEIRDIENKTLEVTNADKPTVDKDAFVRQFTLTTKRISSRLSNIEKQIAEKTGQVERAFFLAKRPLEKELHNLKQQELAAKADLQQLKQMTVQAKLVESMGNLEKSLLQSENLLDFVETNKAFLQADPTSILSDDLLKSKTVEKQRRDVFNAINTKLENLDGSPIDVSISRTQLEQSKAKLPLPDLTHLDIVTQGNIQRWYDAIPDFDACRTTLGRRDLSVVQIEGQALVDKEEGKSRAVERVAHICDSLEKLIKQKWPTADADEITKLVADTVTLMTIDHNYVSILTDLDSIRAKLITVEEQIELQRRIVPAETPKIEYQLSLGTGDKPSCTLVWNKKFKDVEGSAPSARDIKEGIQGNEKIRSTFTLTTTFSRSVEDTSFQGTVALKTLVDDGRSVLLDQMKKNPGLLEVDIGRGKVLVGDQMISAKALSEKTPQENIDLLTNLIRQLVSNKNPALTLNDSTMSEVLFAMTQTFVAPVIKATTSDSSLLDEFSVPSWAPQTGTDRRTVVFSMPESNLLEISQITEIPFMYVQDPESRAPQHVIMQIQTQYNLETKEVNFISSYSIDGKKTVFAPTKDPFAILEE